MRVSPWVLACAAGAGLPFAAYDAASTTVEGVEANVRANTIAERSASGASAVNWHAHVQTVPHADVICWATALAAAAVSTTPIGRAVGDTVVRLTCAVPASRSGAADVSAGTAVVRIRTEVGAGPVAAVDSAIDTVVNACSSNASAVLIRTSQVTPGAALSAVFHVIGQISAVTPATGLSDGAAVVSAGPAVGVGP